MTDARLRAALSLSPAERVETVALFFTAHPGGGAGPLGLGRAVADFVDWEIGSGRIADDGRGSPWWRVVNGGMILDLRDALTGMLARGGDGSTGARGDGGKAGSSSPAEHGPVAAWIAYARGTASLDGGPGDAARAQALMWDAHQASLHAALESADTAALLAEERPAEQEFARLVVEIVDATALHGQATDSDVLARTTARHYPGEYPITPEQWRALQERFAPLLGA